MLETMNTPVLSCLLLFLGISIYSCSEKESVPVLKITNPDKLDKILDYYVDEGMYPFIYAHLEDLEGNIIYQHSTVNKDVLPDTEIDKDTWIRIWSMSKIVTISVALDLMEDGLLRLDDPVSKYIPEFKNLQVAVSSNGQGLTELDWGNRDGACPIRLVPNDSIMTIQHLLTHDAGFYYANTNYACLDSMVAALNLPTASDSDDFINRLATLPLIQHSGTDYFYGINTTVLGILAERASGKNLKQLVAERITTPMQIEGLQYGLPSGENLLPTYTGRDSILREAKPGELNIFGPDVPDYALDHQLYLGGVGMLGTADGYADFLRMLLNRGDLNGHRFLNKETVEDIYAPQTQLDNPYGHDGYNLWVSGDSMRINKTGEAGLWIGGGYECTHFWADPRRNFVGIIMSQNNEVLNPGYEMNDKFRSELYSQFWEQE